ncbi:MAG: iron chelate uptake ABC transporter family permease subunit, partial [Chloroflexota bacterium]
MRTRRLAIGGTLLLVIVAVTAIGIGAVALTPGEVIAAIAQQFGISVGSPVSASTSSIVIELRAPRILAAIVVGAALAVAGGAFQSLLRNPLADPYVLGTSSGAALGAALAFLVPISGAAWELGGVQLAAFVGALLSVALVWRI